MGRLQQQFLILAWAAFYALSPSMAFSQARTQGPALAVDDSQVINLPPNFQAKSIDVGNMSACAIDISNHVFCWGMNLHGPFGVSGLPNSADHAIATIAGNYDQVYAGLNFTCVRQVAGTAPTPTGRRALNSGPVPPLPGGLNCYGFNMFGEAGMAPTPAGPIYAPNLLSYAGGPITAATYQDLSLGAHNGCLIAASGVTGLMAGRVYCWGPGGAGTQGIYYNSANGNPAASLPLQQVMWPQAPNGPDAPIDNAVQLSVGQSAACAVLADGHVQCWGKNSDGSAFADTPFVQDIAGTPLTNMRQVAVGTQIGCAVGAANVRNQVYCWGWASVLGTWQPTGPASGLKYRRAHAITVPGGVAKVEVGFTHACALNLSGTVYCWGNNSVGAIGPAASMGVEYTPIPVVTGAIDISVRDMYGCALMADHSVQCWGPNATTIATNVMLTGLLGNCGANNSAGQSTTNFSAIPVIVRNNCP